MNDKKQAENIVDVVDNTPKEKDLISSEDVLAVVSGDQVALVEQMERAKEAALAQKDNAQEIAAEKAKKKLEEEEKKKQAIMDEVKRRKEEALQREKLAKEEAARKKAEAEAERERQLAEKRRLEDEAKAKAEQEKLEQERKKQEKEAAIKAREEAKKAKIQARIDAKKAKQEASEAAKRAKLEARENAIKAREEAKKAKLEARENAIKAREEAKKAKLEARENAIKAREEAKKAKEQARIAAKKDKHRKMADKKDVVQVNATSPAIPQDTVTSTTPILATDSISKSMENVSNAVESSTTPLSTPILAKNDDAIVHDDKPSTNIKSGNGAKEKDNNFKYYMTFIFLFLLILMVIFLPNISSFVSNYFASKNQEEIPEITTGILTCTMNSSDDKYDYYYEAKFSFKDSKMYHLTFSTTTKGDQTLDALELLTMEASCDLLKNQTSSINGIDVSCSLSNGVYKNIQKLNYENLDVEKVTTAYLEAGGTYPNYRYQQDISDIEKSMKASNYTCERHR